jgi:phosphomethylpyrimidine synthase
MRMSMNTRLTGSARIDSTSVLPSGELRGQTKLAKITEDVRKYAAEQGIVEEGALEKGMTEKSKEFVDNGAKVYVQA